MRRLTWMANLVMIGALSGATLFAGGATAATPSTIHVGPLHWTGLTLSAGTLCSFPISWSGTQEYTSTTFYESDGTTVAMRITQGTEQDTFSANGKTLVGDEYHFTFKSLFENGVRVALYSNGNAERVRLPNGGVFIVAGRDLVTGANVFSVDSGNNANNLAEFCAALS